MEDLQDHNAYLGRCLHCRREISAQGRSTVAPGGPPALPALRENRMVTTSKDAATQLTQRLTPAVFAVCYPTGVTEKTLQDTNLTEVNVGAEDATDSFSRPFASGYLNNTLSGRKARD